MQMRGEENPELAKPGLAALDFLVLFSAPPRLCGEKW
jgi:hypothetical protein